MKNKINLLILAAFFLVLVTTVNVQAVKSFQDYDVQIQCENKNTSSYCSSAAMCNLSISYPDSTILFSDGQMTNQGSYHNYTLYAGQLNELGTYDCRGICFDDGQSTSFNCDFEVTSTGVSQVSILDNPLLIIFLILATFCIGIGMYMGNAWFGFMGSVMLLLSGVYTMIYGLNNISDLYTRGVGITLLGLGIVFMFLSAYEWAFGGED